MKLIIASFWWPRDAKCYISGYRCVAVILSLKHRAVSKIKCFSSPHYVFLFLTFRSPPSTVISFRLAIPRHTTRLASSPVLLPVVKTWTINWDAPLCVFKPHPPKVLAVEGGGVLERQMQEWQTSPLSWFSTLQIRKRWYGNMLPIISSDSQHAYKHTNYGIISKLIMGTVCLKWVILLEVKGG